MAKGSSTPTRVAADVAASAAEVAAAEHRSVTEQINHWVRLGMQVERSASATSRRVLAVVAGDAQFSSLSPEERVIAHSSIDAAMAERAATVRFGPEARRADRSTVSLDDAGNVVRIDPDGTRTIV